MFDYRNILIIDNEQLDDLDLVKQAIDEKIESLVLFWELQYLPMELRIHLKLCEIDEFKKALESLNDSLQKNTYSICLDSIYIIRFSCINELIDEISYKKIIIHELCHKIQQYKTLVMPDQCIWLYESIACYLANQKVLIRSKIPEWDEFMKCYGSADFYAIAYSYGFCLCNSYSQKKLLSMCMDIPSYLQDFKCIYDKMKVNFYFKLDELN